MKLLSLRTKLLVAVFTLVLGSGLMISTLVTQRLSRNLFQTLTAQGRYLSRSLALEATEKILTNDIVALQKLLNSQLAGNPNAAYAFVIRDGRVLAHTFEGGFPLELMSANTPAGKADHYQQLASTDGERYLDFAWPIFGGQAGILRLGISEKPLRTQIDRMWLQMILVTLVILIVTLGISYLFIRRFTHPLTTLANAAEKMDAGNLQVQVEPAGDDEMRRLTGAFNSMVERIRNYTQRLEQKAAELDRAHHQTRSSFEIIQKIGAQTSLTEVCDYLSGKFAEIVSCSRFAFIILEGERHGTYAYSDGSICQLATESNDVTRRALANAKNGGFIPMADLTPPAVPAHFSSAERLAAIPIPYENRTIGALLIACPGGCRCDHGDLEIIQLILDKTAGAIRRAAVHENEIRSFKKQIEATTGYSGLVGKAPQMQTIYRLIEDIGPTDSTVLIQGESGTGKELVARAIHTKSLRADKPFVVINCSAYPATLLESELFGHAKGAFTGAVRHKAGRFELAHEGTVLLDEIGEISATAQIKLLRVLQTQKFERLGGEDTISVNVRMVSATNKDLLAEVKAGRFREDLFYRLNVIPIHLPPLRERRNDIPRLARHFLNRFAAEQNKKVSDYSTETMRLLLDHTWPGNVRELENSIEHAVVLAKGKYVEIGDLPAAIRDADAKSGSGSSALRSISKHESKLLIEVLEECDWNKKEAARKLGISRSTLYNKIKRYGITTPTIH